MVPQVQAAGRRYRLLLSSEIQSDKTHEECNFPPRIGFVAQGTSISERRRLCDAKTQRTIPGAQPSSLIFSNARPWAA